MNTSFTLENASIWVDADDGCYKLSDCTAKLSAVEDIQTFTLPDNGTEYKVKSYRTMLVICGDVKNVSAEFLKTVKRFDLKFTPIIVKQKGCKIEISELDGIRPTEIDLNGEWTFDVTDKVNIIKSLFPELVFG